MQEKGRLMAVLKHRALKWIVVFACMAWAVLFYSKSGVLVSGHMATFVAPDSGKEMKYLTCKYFTGMDFVVKDFWNAKQEESRSCPPIVKLDQ
jgi:hypothetical protein